MVARQRLVNVIAEIANNLSRGAMAAMRLRSVEQDCLLRGLRVIIATRYQQDMLRNYIMLFLQHTLPGCPVVQVTQALSG